MKVAFLFPPPWDPHFPSYAMALFKASTKEAGHEFFDFDLNVDLYRAVQEDDKSLWDDQVAYLWEVDHDKIFHKYSRYLDSYIEKMTEHEKDIYAISINGYSKHLAFYIAKRIKERNPGAAIIVGGPACFPSYDGINILKNKCVDAICTGEGDVIWLKVLDHFERYRNLQIDVSGISYRKNDGTIIDNGVPEFVKDLNAIPFADYSDIDFEKYASIYQLSIMTSRGCINTCAFCSERANFHKYRFRSAENIFNDVTKQLSDFHNNPSTHSANAVSLYINLNDSLINGVPKELENFCDLIIESGHAFKWGGMALIRKEMSADLLVKMKKAGCYHLSWGLESGCQEVLDLMHKRFFNMDLAKKVIKLAHAAGIQQSISLIVGFPGETEEMFNITKEFVAEYKHYFSVSVQPMMILKNSLVYAKPENFGVACVDEWLEWQTIDGTNNYNIRLKKIEMLKSILDGNINTIYKEGNMPVKVALPGLAIITETISLKKRISSHLSHRTKQQIRRALGLLRIRV